MIVRKMEDKDTKKRGIKTLIIILSVLLAVSIAALAGILIYRSVTRNQPATVTVPDNIITPDAESNTPEAGSNDRTEESVPENSTDTSSENTSSDTSTYETDSSADTGVQSNASDSTDTGVPTTSSTGKKEAAVISLYKKHSEDNQPFQVTNMFPGDTETKYFCVRISHSGDVIVRYHADIRPGYEKLTEVLRCRIVLLTTGETLYDGLMRDMPESLVHSVRTDKATESELYYGITAYLDTDVGNAYQNKELIADFRWWVEDTENLDSPQTGDYSNIWLWIAIASGSLLIILVLAWKRRKEEW